MNPEPVGRVPPDGRLKVAIDLPHDVRVGSWGTIWTPGWDRITELESPVAQLRPKADSNGEGRMEALGVDSRSSTGGAGLSEEGNPEPLPSGVLIGKQTEEQVSLIQRGSQFCSVPSAFKEEDARLAPQLLKRSIECVGLQGSVSGRELSSTSIGTESGEDFEVSKMSQGDDRDLALGWDQRVESRDLDPAHELFVGHGRRLDGGAVVFTKSFKVFLGNGFEDASARFGTEGQLEVFQCDPPMTAIQMPSGTTEGPPDASCQIEGCRLEESNREASDAGEEKTHETASVRGEWQRRWGKRPEFIRRLRVEVANSGA